MKDIINTLLGFGIYGLVGSMECHKITIVIGIIGIMVIVVIACLINRKKSAVSRTYNGQHAKRIKNIIHNDYTSFKGGMSR